MNLAKRLFLFALVPVTLGLSFSMSNSRKDETRLKVDEPQRVVSPADTKYATTYQITASTLGLPTSLKTGVKTATISGIEYSSLYAYNSSSSILFSAKVDGYLQNNTGFGGNIKSIVIDSAATRVASEATLYGGATAGATTTTFTGSKTNLIYTYDFSSYSYNYFILKITSASYAVKINSITINFTDSASYLSSYINELDENQVGQCNTRYEIATNRYLALDETEQTKLNTYVAGEDSNITIARERYLAWATYLNKTPYTNDDKSESSLPILDNSLVEIISFAIILSISLVTLGSFIIVKKKNNNY